MLKTFSSKVYAKFTSSWLHLLKSTVPALSEWGIREEEVYRALSPLIKFSLLFTLLPLMVLWPFDAILGLTLSLALFYPSVKLPSLYVVNKILRPTLIAERYSPFIINELIIAFTASGSLHRAVAFVAEGDYPHISQCFKEILRRTEEGIDLERLLLQYAKNAPPTIGEFLLHFIKAPVEHRFSASELQHKVWEVYLEDIKRLRLNILVLFSMGFLLPVPIIAALLIRGTSYLVPLIVPLHTLLLSLTVKTSLRGRVIPLG